MIPAPCTLMWNKAKTQLVTVEDPEARFFFCAAGYPISEDLPIKAGILKMMPAVENKMVGAKRKAPEGDLNG